MRGLSVERLAWLRQRLTKGELWRMVKLKLLSELEKSLGLDETRRVPLALADTNYLFSMDGGEIRRREWDDLRQRAANSAEVLERAYPLVFEHEGCTLRYAFAPARHASRGLLVLFHGLYPAGIERTFDELDILAPLDSFGFKGEGGWFWGTNGQPYIDQAVGALVAQHRDPTRLIFAYGGSMGGFGALWHGIKYGYDGIYAMKPQINLVAKVIDYGLDNRSNHYGQLMGEGLESLPDIYELARQQDDLPPLMLVQNQYDETNFYADHAVPLLHIYDDKQAWYSLRITPSIGHQAWGAGYDEALFFFRLIMDKRPPRSVPFRHRSAYYQSQRKRAP